MNIEELKRLAEAATPGPWVLDELLADFYGFEVRTSTDGKVCADASEQDAAHIAAANPVVVLELIRQREELLASLKEVRDLGHNYTQVSHRVWMIADAAIANAEGKS